MRKVFPSKAFRRDLKRLEKRRVRIDTLTELIKRLQLGSLLPQDKDHRLKGKLRAYRGCHITGDWILVYREIDDTTIELYRTGSHADIYKDRY